MTDLTPVPIAGPVFTEDDWPARLIFFAIVYGPPIAAIAGGLYLAGRFTRTTERSCTSVTSAAGASCW